MASDSDDDWVITTKSTNLNNTSSAYLSNLNGEQHGGKISLSVQHATSPAPPTFSRRHRRPSPSKHDDSYRTRSDQQQYKPTPPFMFDNRKPPSPLPLSATTHHATATQHQNLKASSPTPSWIHLTQSVASRSNGNGNGNHQQQQQQEATPASDAPSSQDIPMNAAPRPFVELLLSTYKNSDQFIVLKDSGNTPYLFQPLADSLHLCADPCTWVQMVLFELGDYFTTYRMKNRDLTPKFQRLLVQAICRGLELYLDAPLVQYPTADDTTTQQQQQHEESAQHMPDLIVFTDDEDEKEADLIDLSFDDDDTGTGAGDDDDNNGISNDDDNEDGAPVVLDLIAPPKPQPQQPQIDEFSSLVLNTNTNDSNAHSKKDDGDDISKISHNKTIRSTETQQHHQHVLTRKHQIAFVDMIRKIEAPSIIYYAMEVFRVTHLLMAGGEYESNGSLLARQLLRQGFYNEAISCIMRLHLQASFPMAQLAEFLFNVGQGGILSVYTKDRPILKYSLLSFINVQLRYNFAGKLGVVDSELLQDVDKDNEHISPLQRMRERRFQKELLNCGLKLIEQLELPEDRYYFIWLSQRYTAIRWVISSRSAQQAAENDYSIDASSNYNGLLELIAEECPTLAKLIIKELVDLQDMIAARHFSTILGQGTFFGFYQSLPPNQRMLGVVRGEQISHGLSSYHGKKRNGGSYSNGDATIYYGLPDDIRYLVVDDELGFNKMQKSLMLCRRCGLDSEWVPTVAKSGKSRTALMQIATDDRVVYLLDLKTLAKPSNKRLLEKTEHALQCLFESKLCLKLAYDFGGDLSLLGECMPSVARWKTNNFKDMNKLRHYNNNKLGSPITGGLAGVVATFLGVSMNKKQQLSNWEKRPLTMDQITYAACDAYCLLQIYDILTKQGHPFAEGIPIQPVNTIVPTFSVLDSSTPSTSSTANTSYFMGVQETPSPHSPPPAFDLIQF